MSDYIQVIDRFYTAKKYRPFKGKEWDCFLHGVLIGRIKRRKEPGLWEKNYGMFIADYDRTDYLGGPRMDHHGEYETFYAAKTGMMKFIEKPVKQHKEKATKKAPAAYLPAADFEFFPTPSNVAGRLLQGVNWKIVETILEPSAGKGDLMDYALEAYKQVTGRRVYDSERIDYECIEIDTNLQAILTGKGYRVVHDDFLSYTTRKRYDLILMNPPFSNGELHLLYALDMIENGGQVACILNAETIRNPYTNARSTLLSKLKKYGATIRYMDDAFAKAERKADVDIALINVSVPYSFVDETIWENLKKARDEADMENANQRNELAPADNIDRLIREHDIMCEAGIALMRSYNGIAPHIQSESRSRYSEALIDLKVGEHERRGHASTSDANSYLRSVRSRYWQQLFDLPQLRNQMTSSMQDEYSRLISQMKDYEFSRFNIQQVVNRIMGQLATGIDEAILKCFTKLSDEHSYNENVQNENIHYYNGWKTNKAHYVNMKCIIPTWGTFASEYRTNSRGSFQSVMTSIDVRGCFSVLSDLEKALNYLDKGETSDIDLNWALEMAKNADRSRNIQCKYFSVTFFKKGTCHIKFHDKKIVDRLNIYVGRNKAWLPPSYGKVRYEEMDEESRRVVDEFQGREEYEKVMENAADYLIDAKEIPLLTA